jgi:hypothetical protein
LVELVVVVEKRIVLLDLRLTAWTGSTVPVLPVAAAVVISGAARRILAGNYDVPAPLAVL